MTAATVQERKGATVPEKWKDMQLAFRKVFATTMTVGEPREQAAQYASTMRSMGYTVRIFPRTVRADRMAFPVYIVVVRGSAELYGKAASQ